MKQYGTRAIDIYDECCNSLGFHSFERGKFGRQQELFAMNATKEGYCVWFLAHSNWTATKNGKWENEIFDSIKHIDEKWDDPMIKRFGEDAEIRVVFAKQKNGMYVFLGVYKCLFIDDDKRVKRYEIISDKYPDGSNNERELT